MKTDVKTILVFGGGGFVGNVLCQHLLKQGYKVRCVENFHKSQCDNLLGLINNRNFEFQYGDITNLDDCHTAVKDVDGIINLAAIVGFPACAKQPALSYAVNVQGTKNLLEARNTVSSKIPFVFASTGSVYGSVEGICTEDSPLNTRSLYGLHKLEAEQAVTNDVNTVAFRFATGFGVSGCMRINLLVNDFVYQALTNNSLVIFQADFRRTFIHVFDMARVFTMGIEQMDTLKYNVYNAGHNELNWTKRELAEYVKEKTGCSVFYGEIGTDADQRDYEVSYRRLQEQGFIPVYTMEAGIDELLKATPLLQVRHQYE